MSKIIKRNWPLVQFINFTSSKKVLECILAHLNKDQTRFISEIILNILLGNLIISSYYKEKLRPKKRLLIKLVSKSTTNKERKRLFISNYATVRLVVKSCIHILTEHSL